MVAGTDFATNIPVGREANFELNELSSLSFPVLSSLKNKSKLVSLMLFWSLKLSIHGSNNCRKQRASLHCYVSNLSTMQIFLQVSTIFIPEIAKTKNLWVHGVWVAYTSLLEPRLSYVLMVQYYVLMVQFNNLPILILVKGKCCIFRMFSTRNNKQGPPGDVRDCVHRLGAIRGHATGLIWLQKLKLAFPDQEIRHDWDSPECLQCDRIVFRTSVGDSRSWILVQWILIQGFASID